jgi:hypothetical protein
MARDNALAVMLVLSTLLSGYKISVKYYLIVLRGAYILLKCLSYEKTADVLGGKPSPSDRSPCHV